jgi:O-antigen/teichoic acid export membrane protein
MPTIAKRLVKGSFLRIFSYLLHVGVAFFLTPFVIYSLGDRMYGFWQVVGTFIGYYGLLDLGFAHAMQRFLSEAIGAKDNEGSTRILNTALILFTAIGLIVLLITFAVYALRSPLTNLLTGRQEDAALFGMVVLVLGANMAIDLPMKTFTGVLFSTLRFDIMSGLEVITLLLRTSLIVMVLKLGCGVFAMAVVTALSGIPEKLLTFYFAKKNLPYVNFGRQHWNVSIVKMLLAYSSYSFIWKISEVFKSKIDVIVISIFISLSAVTHYSIGSLLAGYFHAFMIASLGMFMPLFGQLSGEQDDEKVRQTFFFGNKICIFVSSFIGFGLIAWGKAFIERWMGGAYLDAYPVLVVLVITLMVGLWQVPSIEFLWITKGYKLVGIMSLIGGVSKLILSLILVKHLGMVGVAVGTLVPGTVTSLVVLPIFVSRYLGIRWVVYVRKIGRNALVGVLALICPTIISIAFVSSDYMILGAIGIVSFVIYAGIIWFSGFKSQETDRIRIAAGWWKRKTAKDF